jgi:hypothetical protein
MQCMERDLPCRRCHRIRRMVHLCPPARPHHWLGVNPSPPPHKAGEGIYPLRTSALSLAVRSCRRSAITSAGSGRVYPPRGQPHHPCIIPGEVTPSVAAASRHLRAGEPGPAAATGIFVGSIPPSAGGHKIHNCDVTTPQVRGLEPFINQNEELYTLNT